ncbi:MAG: aminotransferase class III-fold pyridoxal phosphate-dependent enzyme [Acidimicrobiaceae bacterium]|nr:aminotransferase class III-fold pyridoxal phosphate-dependent enzyme [Acidimicrobiaceae bacterium]
MTTQDVKKARSDFADRNPESRKYFEEARNYLPGGHTRTVLTHAPFPLVFASGEGSTLTDLDGHIYIDMLGDYTAGLLGHSEHRVIDAVTAVLKTNVSVGGIHPAESRLAKLMCERFALDRVRFTNSGTEANLMAITTAMQATGRKRIMVFHGGYHGGILYFASGAAPWNAPYEFVVAPYNEQVETIKLITEYSNSLAAVIIEPMLGSGGCVPTSAEFAKSVFNAAKKVGAVVIADEVMTSRHGAHGMFDLLGVKADITTFGKYIGGGFSFGAFGGRAELLDQFDTSPEANRDRTISHAGTFNNNISSMSAGCVVLEDVFTTEIAIAHTDRGDEFRQSVEAVLARHDLPVSISGFGSMMSLHALAQAPRSPIDVAKRDNELQELLFFGLLERGVYTAARGMMNLSLPLTDDQLAKVLDALDETVKTLAI